MLSPVMEKAPITWLPRGDHAAVTWFHYLWFGWDRFWSLVTAAESLWLPPKTRLLLLLLPKIFVFKKI
jgi:hypothetical protein